MNAGFEQAFGIVSPRERRQAELFFHDLLGHRTRSRCTCGRSGQPGEQFGKAIPADALASDLFGPGEAADESSAASREDAPAPPARDVAVTERMALLVTTHAPLPVTAAEIDRTRGDQGALDDYKSVCAIVPAVPENRLLIYFHGNNQYVTVAPRGDVRASAEPSRHSRAPRWADERARARAVAKAATPFDFGLTSLAERQRGLAPSAAFSALPVKDPIVLVPEDAELKKSGDYWSVPPKKQYGAAPGEAPNGPGAQRLSNLVLECYERLRALPNPSGQRYLDPNMTSRASWASNVRRVYLSGHSGGGKPLLEAAGSDLVLVGSSSVMGVGGRAVDLWLFDCTYGFGTQSYVNFCQNWHDAGLLGAGPNASRLVCVYRPGTPEKGTEAEADRLRSALAKVLGAKADSLRKLHDSTDMASRSMREDVIPALTSSPVVFIRTHVGHDQIPTLFTPLLLRTAAS